MSLAYVKEIAQLYVECKNTLFGIAYKKTGDKMLAEDVIHEVFMRILKNPTLLDPNKRNTWKSCLCRAMINEIITRFRKNEVAQSHSHQFVQQPSYNTCDHKIDAVRILDYMVKQNTKQMKALMMIADGMSREEIGSILKIKPRSVSSHKTLAVRKLRETFPEFC